MLQNLISTVLVHNRPSTPLIHTFASTVARSNAKRPRICLEKFRGNRRIYSYPPLRKDKENKSKASGVVDKQNENNSQKPPWPPYGPSPSCCQPASDQSCSPPPPRNPNPLLSVPQPCIKEPPPPPWNASPKEVPNFCQMPHLPPLPPVSSMPAEDEKVKSKSKKLDEKFLFDIFDECDDVLYAGDDAKEFYDELDEYFAPTYKILEYHSYTQNSYNNMAVHLSKYHSFDARQ